MFIKIDLKKFRQLNEIKIVRDMNEKFCKEIESFIVLLLFVSTMD